MKNKGIKILVNKPVRVIKTVKKSEYLKHIQEAVVLI